jgi:hypothetical protein
MRYSAIAIFSDGSFFDPTWNNKDYSIENIIQNGLDTDELKEYLKEHKYVIVKYLGTNFMVFEESHLMFNVGLIDTPNMTNIMPYRSRTKIHPLVYNLIDKFDGFPQRNYSAGLIYTRKK